MPAQALRHYSRVSLVSRRTRCAFYTGDTNKCALLGKQVIYELRTAPGTVRANLSDGYVGGVHFTVKGTLGAVRKTMPTQATQTRVDRPTLLGQQSVDQTEEMSVTCLTCQPTSAVASVRRLDADSALVSDRENK